MLVLSLFFVLSVLLGVSGCIRPLWHVGETFAMEVVTVSITAMLTSASVIMFGFTLVKFLEVICFS